MPWGSDVYRDGYSFAVTSNHKRPMIFYDGNGNIIYIGKNHTKYYQHRDKQWRFGVETTLSKKRRRKYEAYIKEWQAVDNEYCLGITAYEYHTMAYHLAEREASSELKWYNSLATYEFWVGVILIVIGIALYKFGGGWLANLGFSLVAAETLAAASGVLMIVGNIAQLCVSFYSYQASASVMGKNLEANRMDSAKQGLQNIKDAEQKTNTLTHLIVYGGYEIYANGSIYKMQNAGSQTFDCNVAFDTTKGLRGDLQKSELGDKIAGRHGQDAAGGVYFMQNILKTPFEIKKITHSAQTQLDALGDNLQYDIRQLATGFQKILDNNFANGSAEELTANDIYQNCYKRIMRPLKTKIKNVSFMNALEYYRRGLRFPTDWIREYHFTERKQEFKFAIEAFNLENFKIFMNNKENSIEQKAEYLINCIYYSLFKALEDLSEDENTGDFSYQRYLVNTRLYEGKDDTFSLLDFSIFKEVSYYNYFYYHSGEKVEKIGWSEINSNKTENVKLTDEGDGMSGGGDDTQYTKISLQTTRFANNAPKHSFGYNYNKNLFKDQQKTKFVIGDFSILGGYFEVLGDDLDGLELSCFDKKEKIMTGDEILDLYLNEFLQCFLKIEKLEYLHTIYYSQDYQSYEGSIKTGGSVYCYAFYEPKSAYGYNWRNNIISVNNNFWAIDCVNAEIFKKMATPLFNYIDADVLAELDEFDFSTIKIKETYYVKKANA